MPVLTFDDLLEDGSTSTGGALSFDDFMDTEQPPEGEEVPMDYELPDSEAIKGGRIQPTPGRDMTTDSVWDRPLPEGLDSSAAQAQHIQQQRATGTDEVNIRDPLTGIPGGGVIQLNPKEQAVKRDLTQLGMGKANELPVPGTAMYDGLDQETAVKLYSYYANHPDTRRDALGRLEYKGTIIPTPVRGGSAMVARSMTSGASNALKEGLLFLASGADEAIAEVTGKEAGVTQWVDRNFAENNPQGVVEEFATQMVQAGIGMATGYKLAGGKSNPKQMGAANRLIAYGLASAGAGATMDSDAGTLVAGHVPGIGFDLNNTRESADILEAKLNMIADEFVLAGIADSAIKATAMVGKLANEVIRKPVVRQFSEKARERQQGELLIRMLGFDVDDPKSFETVREFIRRNKTQLFDIQDTAVGAKTTGRIERTTMGAVAEGLNDPSQGIRSAKETDEAIRRAMDVEQSIPRGPKLQEKLGQPKREVARVSESMAEQSGGRGATDAAARQVQGMAKQDVNAARTPAEAAKRQYQKAEAKVRELLLKDPKFGAAVRELEEASQTQIHTGREAWDAKESAVALITRAANKLIDMKDAKYAAIPDTARIDFESIAPLLADAMESGAAPKSIGPLINPDMSFKTLFNDVLPKITKMQNTIRNSTDPDANKLELLQAIKENITNHQIDFLSQSGDEATAAAATEARRFYKEVFAPIGANDTQLGDVFTMVNMLRQNRTVPENVSQTALNTLNKAMKDDQRYAFESVMNLIRSTESKKAQQAIPDIAIGSVIKNIRNKALDGTQIKDLKPSDFVKPLQEYAGVLRQQYPEAATKIDNFLKRLQTGKQKLSVMDSQLQDIVKASEEAEEQILSSALGKFINVGKATGLMTNVENGFDVLSKMLRNPQGETAVRQLMDRATRPGQVNEVVVRGLKAGYFKHLKELVTQGAENYNKTNIDMMTDPESPLWRMGQVIFRDTPEVLDAYASVLRAAQTETARRGGTNTLAGMKDSQKEAFSSASNTIITMIFGVLDRIGARARSGSSAVRRTTDPQAVTNAMLDQIYADPEFAMRVLKDTQDRVVRRENKNAMKWALRAAVRGGLYEPDGVENFPQDWDEAVTDFFEDQQTKDMIK